MIARRLLMGGGGSFTVPLIPEQGRWSRQGAVLTATAGWEGLGVLEPAVVSGGGDIRKMWYRGGGLHGPSERIGYATSTNAGLTWSKYGSNPILGEGTGGEAGAAICPHVQAFGGTTYLYYSAPDSGKWRVAASADGLPAYTITESGLALPSGCIYFGNQSVWLDGSTYRALVEAYHSADALWKTYLASSSSPASGWTIGNGGSPLTTLSVGGMWGGPDVHVVDGRAQSWYHAATSGNTPTDIYRGYADSPFTSWTVVTPNPILTHLGSAYEIDQVADPCIVEAGASRTEMYYDADDNATDIAAIKLATFAGSLTQLLAGT